MAPSTRSSRQANTGTVNPPSSSSPSEVREEPPERIESASLTVEERIAAAEKRRDELRALQHLRDIEADII